jgi:hypothetical protein
MYIMFMYVKRIRINPFCARNVARTSYGTGLGMTRSVYTVQVLGVLSWHYAAVVHTQTDYGTTGYEALGRRLPIHQRNLGFSSTLKFTF